MRLKQILELVVIYLMNMINPLELSLQKDLGISGVHESRMMMMPLLKGLSLFFARRTLEIIRIVKSLEYRMSYRKLH